MRPVLLLMRCCPTVKESLIVEINIIVWSLFMSFQPKEEKETEWQLIRDFAKVTNSKVIKLQGDNDDGGTDGVIEYNGKEKNVEARRKGYPNHSGKVSSFFEKGWNSRCLVSGIFLNELTIQKYKAKGKGFIWDAVKPLQSEGLFAL